MRETVVEKDVLIENNQFCDDYCITKCERLEIFEGTCEVLSCVLCNKKVAHSTCRLSDTPTEQSSQSRRHRSSISAIDNANKLEHQRRFSFSTKQNDHSISCRTFKVLN